MHGKEGVTNSVGALWWLGGAWGLVGLLFVVVVWLGVRPSLHFYGMIILVKKGLCRGMAWLPFQKSIKLNIIANV